MYHLQHSYSPSFAKEETCIAKVNEKLILLWTRRKYFWASQNRVHLAIISQTLFKCVETNIKFINARQGHLHQFIHSRKRGASLQGASRRVMRFHLYNQTEKLWSPPPPQKCHIDSHCDTRKNLIGEQNSEKLSRTLIVDWWVMDYESIMIYDQWIGLCSCFLSLNSCPMVIEE